ncbi:MAG: trimethylamine corrinoid protein 2 [bacterium]|nr:trimethylamine corrinoid protein 2 [bacterium]
MMWKANWEETKRHFTDWWRREGLVVGMWGAPMADGRTREEGLMPPAPASPEAFYLEAETRARRNHYELARQDFPGDALPLSATEMGPGSLACFLGSSPRFTWNTVWYDPCIQHCADPEALPPLKFDPANRWWKLTEETVRRCAELANGKYMVGCPDLIENIDILASLRDSQTLMTDLLVRPDWVERKVREINQVWFDAYQRVYDIIKLEDGSSAYGPFRLWGSGKTAKVQCDASAMFSPEMFQRFVVPALTEQCRWLDHSMYHLDGTQAMCHLDALLAIEPLDAIEWTPQAGVEQGGNPRWFEMYRRILAAGKSLQVVGVPKQEVRRLLDAIGGRGVYILSWYGSLADAEEVMAIAEAYR